MTSINMVTSNRNIKKRNQKRSKRDYDSFQDALYLNDIGVHLYDRGMYRDSLDYFQKALNLKGGNLPFVSYNVGLAFYMLEDYRSAIEIFDKEELAFDVEALRLKGDSYAQLKDFAGALDSYNNVLELKADSIETYVRKALTLQAVPSSSIENARRIQEEIDDCYETIVKIRKDDYVQACLDISHELYDLKRDKDALFWLDKAIDLAPKDSYLYVAKGVILSSTELKKYEESIIMYDRALELDKNNIEAIYNKYLLLKFLNRFNEAKEVYIRYHTLYYDLHIDKTQNEVHNTQW
jgi:tetratricopeptide (TPR) repeat protein